MFCSVNGYRWFLSPDLQLIQTLLKSDRVYEKSKSRLRLCEVGLASLTGLLSASEVTCQVAKELVNLFLMGGRHTPVSLARSLFILSYNDN